MTTIAPRRVTSTDGVSLAVHERGDAANPTIVAIHGYPDNHSVWDPAATLLAERFHVVTYDVRGTGASDKPERRSAYKMAQLTADLEAVIDAVSPSDAVHLMGHDWGSVQGWGAVVDPRLHGRIASFVSISGPSLDYSAAWFRDLRDHPRAAARQLAHSYYILLFQLPGVPEFLVRQPLFEKAAAKRGWGAGSAEHPVADRVNGLSLYRANVLGRMRRPAPVHTDIPVLVIAPDADPFLTVDISTQAPKRFVRNLSVRTVSGGHWVISSDAAAITQLVTSFLSSLAEPRRP